MDSLNISLVQTNPAWENPEVNMKEISQLIGDYSIPTDLFILPEMFNTGFSMLPEKWAERMDGQTIQVLQQLSLKKNAAITGSLMIEDNGYFYNRLVWVEGGVLKFYYDKRHLFSLVGEDEHFTPGKKPLILEYKGWKIQPFICYDLRFPVWCRSTENVDLQIYVANWPEKRIHYWKALLQARAIENICYIAAVNRIGKDFWGNNHNGDSCLVTFNGDTAFLASNLQEIKSFTISKKDLAAFRERYPFNRDKDNFEIYE